MVNVLFEIRKFKKEKKNWKEKNNNVSISPQKIKIKTVSISTDIRWLGQVSYHRIGELNEIPVTVKRVSRTQLFLVLFFIIIIIILNINFEYGFL